MSVEARRSLCPSPALFVSGPGALCVGVWRSLCRGPAPLPTVAVSGPRSLCRGPALSVSEPGALCRGPAISVSSPCALCVVIRRCPALSVSRPGAVCVTQRATERARERRASTQRGGVRHRSAGPDTENAGPDTKSVRERQGRTQRAPGSAGLRHKLFLASLCRAQDQSVSGPRRCLCWGPALSVSCPGALCVGPPLSVRGPALSVSGPGAFVSRPQTLCRNPALSVSGSGSLRVQGPLYSLAVCVGPGRAAQIRVCIRMLSAVRGPSIQVPVSLISSPVTHSALALVPFLPSIQSAGSIRVSVPPIRCRGGTGALRTPCSPAPRPSHPVPPIQPQPATQLLQSACLDHPSGCAPPTPIRVPPMNPQAPSSDPHAVAGPQLRSACHPPPPRVPAIQPGASPFPGQNPKHYCLGENYLVS